MTDSSPAFDPAKYKATTRQQWDDVADAWHKWIHVVRRWAGPVTGMMLDLARIGPGSRVLDIAAGDGDQSLTVAQRVGASGYVLATDIAPNLVAIATRVFRGAGLKNAEARVMDAEALTVEDASFDAVICRFGLFFLPNVSKGLLEMRRALKPGGRIAAVVFSEKNPFFSLPISVIRKRAQLPPPLPGHEAEREEAWREIGRGLAKYEGPQGFESPCEVVIGVGVR